ncbi:MAG TPA: ATP-dependent helicase C-terminal domain-containing protein, partial [Vicinamibacterales bacterium]|nr:ATP-dependent helicase C-terminal domain-containing protein [Vicinamibacterales bacterium]
TKMGEQAIRLPVHPRLARMLIAADGAREMAQACALISERHFLAPRTAATTSDLLSAIDEWQTMPAHVQRAAREIEISCSAKALAERGQAPSRSAKAVALRLSDAAFRRALLTGYPDRVAQRRDAGSRRVRLSSGAGATLAPESGVVDGEFLVAIDAQASRERIPRTEVHAGRGRPHTTAIVEPNDARVRLASVVEREWLAPTTTEVVHRFDRASGTVRAVEIDRYDALVLAERPVPTDPEHAAPLLAEAWLARGPSEADAAWLRRLRFAGREVDMAEIVRRAASCARTLSEIQLARGVPPDVLRALDREAPPTIAVPSGRTVTLDYGEDGSVSAAVKLQELFGLAETPRIGARQEPVRLALLAPNGRPVQMTRDLRSFWDRTYPEVRKELRGRYPKHPWPDDPWKAMPTRRTKRQAE